MLDSIVPPAACCNAALAVAIDLPRRFSLAAGVFAPSLRALVAGSGRQAMAERTHIRALARAALAGPALVLLAAPSTAQAPAAPVRAPYQWPETLQNGRILPATIGADGLRATMQAFTAALGVRCVYCHVGTDDMPLSQVDFVSDANPKKGIARAMMTMTWQINNQMLTPIEGLNQPRVSCYSCHRGTVTPALRPTPPAPPVPPAPPAPGS